MLLRRPRLIGLRALAFRYLRLTPTLAFVLAAFAALVPHLGSGPWWYKMRTAAEGCDRWWWSTLLYLNNVAPVHYPQQCMPWTWYPNPNPNPDPDPDPNPDPNPTSTPTPTPNLVDEREGIALELPVARRLEPLHTWVGVRG